MHYQKPRHNQFHFAFHPLTHLQICRIAENKISHAKYIDALMYMHDLLCELDDSPFHNRYNEKESYENINSIIKYFSQSFAEISKSISKNVEQIKQLKKNIPETNLDNHIIKSFLQAIIREYQNVRNIAQPAAKYQVSEPDADYSL
jgi:hypothetical protein